MAEFVYVSSRTTGVPVAAETIGTKVFQAVKLVDGAAGATVQIAATSGIPGASSAGLIVAVKPGASVTAQVSGNVTVAGSVQAQVSGTVQVSGQVEVSGTVAVASVATVNTLVTILSTVDVRIVAGAGGGGSVTTAPPSVSATGQVVWLAGGQSSSAFPIWVTGTVAAGAGTTVISGTVSVSGTAVVTLATGGTIATLLGTVNVSIAQTSVVAQLSGMNFSTTALSGVTGPVVWLGASQTVLVSTVVSGTVSVSGTVVVTLATGGTIAALLGTAVVTLATGGTVATLLGTVLVSVVPGVSVNVGSQATGVYTTTATSGATGPIVWLGASQSIIVSTLVSGTVSVSGTVVVTLATGGTLATLLGTVAVSIAQTSVSVAAVPTVNTIITILSTVNVAIVAGAGGGGSVTTSSPSISATGQVMWLAGGQSTTANPIFVSQINAPAAGGGSVTTAPPSVSATGQVVWLAGGQSSSAFPIWVTGTVAAGAGTTVISGTVSVGNTVVVTLATGGTIAQLLGTAVVTLATGGTVATLLGTVLVSVVGGGASPGSTAGTQSNISGQVIWLAPTQTLAVVSTIVTILGTAHVTGTIQNVASLSTILGTAVVSVVPGVSVTIQQGASVSAVVSGTVSVNTVATLLGTINITWPSIVAVTTAASVSVTGLPVWMNPTQQVVVSGLVGHSVTGSVNIVSTAVVTLATGGTIAQLLGTAVVTLATGGTVATLLGTVNVSIVQTSVVAQASGTVTVIPIDRTTATPSAAGTGAIVWVANPGGAVATTIITVGISNVAPVVTQASVSVSGVPVWWNPTAQVAISGGVLAGAVVTGTQIATSGQIIWLGPTQTITAAIAGTAIVTLATGGTVAVLDVGRTNVIIVVTSSTVGISGSTIPFGLYVGLSTPVAGTTSWVVPAGKVFRVLSVELIAQNSVTTAGALVRLFVVASTALPTWSTTTPILAAVQVQAVSATVAYSAVGLQVADIPAGATVGMAFSIGTSGASIVQALVKGYLFPILLAMFLLV